MPKPESGTLHKQSISKIVRAGLKSDPCAISTKFTAHFAGPMTSGHRVLNDFVDLPIYANATVEYNRYSHFVSVLDGVRHHN